MAQIRRILHPEEGYYSPAPSDCSQSCNNTLFCNSCLSPTSIPDGFIPKTPFLPPPSAPFVDVNVTAPFVSHKATGHLTLTALVIASVLAAFFLLITYYLLILRYRSYLRRQRAAAALNTPRGPGPSPEEDEDEDAPFNQDGGAAVHHVWFIRTVGLEQPMIDSITVCPYRRGDGLIESTDCSVCLSEFEDGELVRLLPKCCHAFHLPCIDTWLRSHLNCPLCRAPIVSPAFPPAATVEAAATSAVTVAATVPAGNPDSAVPIGVALVSESTDVDSSDDSSDGQQTPTALGMIFAVPEEREESGIIGDSSSGNGNNPPAPPVASLSVAEFGFRVQSDLGGFGGRRQLGNDEEEWVTVDLGSDREIQPYRRSVSMDISALGALFHREEDEEGHSEGAVTSCKAKLPPYLREVLPATPAGLRMMKQGRDPKGGNLLQKEAFGVERCSSANSGGYIFSRLGRGRSRSHASILPL